MLTIALSLISHSAEAQSMKRGDKQIVQSGIIQRNDSLLMRQDSLDNLSAEIIKQQRKEAKNLADSLARIARRKARAEELGRLDQYGNIIPREPLFSDSSSLSKVCLTAAILPGYGQIYNKQYWKLPILYGTLGASIGLTIDQGGKYRTYKRQYEELTLKGLSRTEEMNLVQRDMIRHNTKRQLFMAAAAASYIYFLGDAALNYATNNVSNVKKATTLSLICPGAGQIYNKSYWRAPIVVGGLASMVYVIDWNNRGFQRFKTAYSLRADFEQNPDKYPEGVSPDEFKGRYSASYLKNLRDSYRRNRDLSLLLTAGVYIFQAVDAHVDAHLKDFDISDELSVELHPIFDYQHTQINGSHPVFGVNLNITF
ncbi:MAG: hypothetical protein IKY25_01900 [Alistipes sp.]|nr:hypothetical protein [Alistipes sp.]